ncbi:unnamed protein product, partial [Mesorhabditis spiculigera]
MEALKDEIREKLEKIEPELEGNRLDGEVKLILDLVATINTTTVEENGVIIDIAEEFFNVKTTAKSYDAIILNYPPQIPADGHLLSQKSLQIFEKILPEDGFLFFPELNKPQAQNLAAVEIRHLLEVFQLSREPTSTERALIHAGVSSLQSASKAGSLEPKFLEAIFTKIPDKFLNLSGHPDIETATFRSDPDF